MEATKQPHATRILGKPEWWDEEALGPCYGLPVTDADGVMYSYWQTSIQERLQILFGRPIRLAVVGTGHPAVALDTEKI